MSEVSILIIEPSSQSHTYASWIEERGPEVSIASSLQTAKALMKRQTYDLILLSDALWAVGDSTIGKLLQDRPFMILSSAYTIEGYRDATAAGAKGYVDRELDQDAFIRELEKVLRREGLVPKRGRVLVVDNDPHVLSALKSNLEREGFQVATASTADNALSSIENHHPHVIVVDIRLKDDDDPLDESGFDLIQQINDQYGHAVRIVGLTGSPTRGTASRATELVSRFVLKLAESAKGKNDLVAAIEAARDELGINNSIDIEFAEPLSLPGLVKMMKAYKDLSEEQQRSAALELEELIRKLFQRELGVKGYYLSPGRGGSGVVLMRPIIEGTKGECLVIKFGPRENIATELRNYNLYVRHFVGRRSTHLVDIADKPVETLHLGGLKFSFAGMSVDRPQDFSSFYRDPATTKEEICRALRYTFKEACRRWYQAKRDWPEDNPGALAEAYESHLSLQEPDKRQELVIVLEKLLNGQAVHGISFRPHDREGIEVCIDDKKVILSHPLVFANQHRTKLPAPRFQCRSHGDLNGRNMFVDKDASVWLIDFYKTGWGPLLRDFVELETVIKFELTETPNLTVLYDLEKALLRPAFFKDPIEFSSQFSVEESSKAVAAIGQLRKLAQSESETLDIKEYYAGLLFFAIKMLTWEGISSAEQDRFPVRQRHALLSAAMIAYRLQNWDDEWEGWPDERAIIYAA